MSFWRPLVLVVTMIAVGIGPASAADDGTAVVLDSCGAVANLDGVGAGCRSEGEKLQEAVSTAPSGTVYDVRIKCSSDVAAAVCSNPIVCDAPPGSIRYDVFLSTDFGVTFAKTSEACLTTPPDGQAPVLTPGAIIARFKEIAWGESPMVIQPPGGRTLVNFETNFYTTNVGPRSQTVTMLGQQVEIEATPSTWTWRHGDGSEQATSVPGAAYPDLRITHAYLDAGVTVKPSVDTTYSGRYRVNGGDWVTIADTVKVTGAAAALEVVSARPQLVAAE